ncbi:F(420)H(2) dehydrogenase subunit A [uncultured archaeon]|nr:F(420)H(2) dehydrogenase subunit A [uncultured archaeon]
MAATNAFFDNYLPVAILTVIGVVFVAVSLFMSRMVRPSKKTKEKLSTYECAEVPVGDARIHFNIQYYLIVIVFLVFDVEVLFLYPWAVQFRQLGSLGFFEMVVFIEVLVIGLAYAWRKEALEWIQ